MDKSANKVQQYEAITADELFHFDILRGDTFIGPTPEEVLEWDEITAMTVDQQMLGEGATASMAEEKQYLEKLQEFLSLVRLRHEYRSDDVKQRLKRMEERGEMPWQLR
jgi:hypothetical protein